MVKSDRGLPPVPKDVCDATKATYKRLRRLLAARGTVTKSDADILSLYCFVHDRACRARAHLAAEGEVKIYTRLDSNGRAVQSERPNLWLKIAQDSERQALVCLQQLGLTPKSRKDIKPEPNNEADDILTMLLEESEAERQSKNKTVQ